MARRILYNPADFVEASTPFYENIIGTITDQTDRISRNIERAKEKELLEENRAWQESQLQLQLDSRRQLQDDQQEFAAEQSDISRTQSNIQFNKQMTLEWYKLRGQQQSATLDALNSELAEKERGINDLWINKIRPSGFASSEAPLRFNVIKHPDTGQDWVVNPENGGRPVLPYDDFVQSYKTIVNFQDMFTGGKNVDRWIEDNMQMNADTYTDAESDATLLSGNDMLRVVSEIRSGTGGPEGMQKNMQLLKDIMEDGSNVRLLMKEDPDADVRDPLWVAERAYLANSAINNSHNYQMLFQPSEPGKPDRFISEVQDNPDFYVPMLFEQTLFNMSDVKYPAQTIGQMEKRYRRLRNLAENTKMSGVGDDIENVRSGIEAVEDLGRNFLLYSPEMIPDNVKHIPISTLVKTLKVNRAEMEKPRPDITNLFEIPTTEEEVDRIIGELDWRSTERVRDMSAIKEGLQVETPWYSPQITPTVQTYR